MKKYKFRLQTVLGMRQKVLEEKQLEMAKVVSLLNMQLQVLEDLLNKKELTKKNLEKIYENNAELDILEITNHKNFFSKMINNIKIQEEVIKNIQIVLNAKQQEVTEALKEVKILEKLKEKQEKKFYQHYEYLQGKEIDDIASTRYQKMTA
ncbi:MAG TPA: flagellar export protein FliJ [Candidatus Gastranaerophilaceae bacterium]|nr:flagellar export protein FliJ [Candidatus Gastranaerophilaceae bacterium]